MKVEPARARQNVGMEDESADLARRAIAGDRAALDELWRIHRRWVAAVVLAHRARRADVDDLLQEVALAVVRNVRHLREADRFRPWLRAIAANTARTAGRRRAAGPITLNGHATLDGVVDRSSIDGSSRDESTPPDPGATLDAALGLPILYREPLLLWSVRGMGVRAIGELLDLPVKTVETRIRRARLMLVDSLRGRAIEDSTSATGAP